MPIESTYCVMWCPLNIPVRMVMEWNSCRIEKEKCWYFRVCSPFVFCLYGYFATFTCSLPGGHFASRVCRSSREYKKTKTTLQFQKPALTATSSSAFHLEGGPTYCGAVCGCGSAGLIQQFGKKISFKIKCLEIFSPPHEYAFILFLVFFFFLHLCRRISAQRWLKPKDAQEFDRLLKLWHE